MLGHVHNVAWCEYYVVRLAFEECVEAHPVHLGIDEATAKNTYIAIVACRGGAACSRQGFG